MIDLVEGILSEFAERALHNFRKDYQDSVHTFIARRIRERVPMTPHTRELKRQAQIRYRAKNGRADRSKEYARRNLIKKLRVHQLADLGHGVD